MRKISSYILLILITVFVSCCKDDAHIAVHNVIRMTMQLEQMDGESPTRALPSTLSDLKAAIYDQAGNRLQTAQLHIESDFSSIVIENLPDGSYTIACFGLGEVRNQETSSIIIPQNINDTWVTSPHNDTPCNNEYFHAKVPVTVIAGVVPLQKITLQRIVARVDIKPVFETESLGYGSLSEAVISFNDEALFGNSFTAAGDLDYTTTLKNLDILADLSFYTLPPQSTDKLSGTVMLKGLDSGGKEMVLNYKFSISVERNKISTIVIKHIVPDNQFGTIKIYDNDRKNLVVNRFFHDGDSYSAIASRSFRPINPIEFRKKGKNIVITCYVAEPIKNVSIYIGTGSADSYFEIAWLESINPFEEIFIEMDLPTNKVYRTESGNVVRINEVLLNENVKVRYGGPDPRLESFNKIMWPMTIRFSPPSADTINIKPTNRILPLRPGHVRGAIVLFTNMGYILSTDEWRTKMRNIRLYDDKEQTVDFDKVLLPKIMAPNTAITSILNPYHQSNPYYLLGLANVGDGKLYSFVQRAYLSFDNPGADTFMTAYHEYGHVLGYNHDSNLSYGAPWHNFPMQSATTYMASKELPYYNRPASVGKPQNY